MRLLFLNIIILYIDCVLPFNITKEITLDLSIPSPLKMKNYQINYYQGVKVDICNYDKNDSYIWEGYTDTLTKIENSYFRYYFESQTVYISGSDLKFIQIGSVSYRTLRDPTENDIQVEKSFTKFKVIIKIQDSSSDIYLFIVKNDNTNYINICNLFNGISDIVYSEVYESVITKSMTVEFDLKSGFKKEDFKVIVLEYTNDKIYLKIGFKFIQTTPCSLIVLLIVLGCILGIAIIIVIIIIIIKKCKIEHIVYNYDIEKNNVGSLYNVSEVSGPNYPNNYNNNPDFKSYD